MKIEHNPVYSVKLKTVHLNKDPDLINTVVYSDLEMSLLW